MTVPFSVPPRVRFGVPWTDLNYVRDMDHLQAPALVFHGVADPLVPLRTSQLLASSCPDLVRCVAVPGATHGRAWNLDRDRYERVAREFLERVARPQTPSKKKERGF